MRNSTGVWKTLSLPLAATVWNTKDPKTPEVNTIRNSVFVKHISKWISEMFETPACTPIINVQHHLSLIPIMDDCAQFYCRGAEAPTERWAGHRSMHSKDVMAAT